MCAITGIINFGGRESLEEDIWKMTNSMFHRGPDGGGIYIDKSVSLGHRRLSILDLSLDGHQPFHMNDLVLSFNGEIYNYQEIKQGLRGSNYRSKTDTEVVLKAYYSKGIDCIKEFNGMFAFALYDKSKQKVFLVRDRLGVKPLYYAKVGDEIIFGSEIKAILSSGRVKSSVSKLAVSSYLSFRYPVGSQSMFEEISQLDPGHYLEIDLNSRKVDKIMYWDIPIEDSKVDLGEQYYIDEIKWKLSESVRYRMISDVDFGAYLSGGVDSSAIVALMSKLNNKPIKTYTIGFEEEDYNEFYYSNLVAQKYNTDHRTLLLDPKTYFETMDSLIGYKDAPLSVPNEPALYIMSKELKKDFTVVLSGEGADELFGGYGRIFRSPWDYNRMKFIQDHQIKTDSSDAFQRAFNAKYGTNNLGLSDIFLKQYKYIDLEDKKGFMSDDFLSFNNEDKSLNDFFEKQFIKTQSLSYSEQFIWIFQKIHIQGLLNRLDTTTMAASVEGRVPFVDHKLIEFGATIPLKYKLKWKSEKHKLFSSNLTSDRISEVYDIPKYILKKAFEDSLPEEVLWRKKVGFPVPLHKWFGDSFYSYAKEILLDDMTNRVNIFDRRKLEIRLKEKNGFINHSFGLKIWMLVNLQLWINKYMNK